MQIEIYKMIADGASLTITLEAICDSFSSLLWDIEYYKCGSFEVYIAASPRNIDIFQTGRIIGRDDDSQHFGLIESVQIDTNAENGDYLTVRGRFLMCLLERRIIYPTLSFTALTAYSRYRQDGCHAECDQFSGAEDSGTVARRHHRRLLGANRQAAGQLRQPDGMDVYDLRENWRHGKYPAGKRYWRDL